MKRFLSLLILSSALQVYADTINDPCAYGVCGVVWTPTNPGSCDNGGDYAPGCRSQTK